MSSRFFVEPAIQGDSATLTDSEAHHLIHVMRAAVGEEVILFDGGGQEFTASVAKIGRSQVELQVLSQQSVDRELPFPLTLGVALPKGDRQRWLIEKATELGVTRIVPLLTERGVAQPAKSALKRLQRAVIESSKQCGRNRLLQIDEPQSLNDYVNSAPAEACRLLAHPDGDAIANEVKQTADTYLAVGPEGGFTDDEVKTATAAGWQTVGLGPRILRIETAAVALVVRVSEGR